MKSRWVRFPLLRTSLVVVRPTPSSAGAFEQAATRVGAVLPALATTSRWFSRAGVGVVVSGYEPPVEIPDRFVVGYPVSETGPCSDLELEAVLERPDAIRHLAGAFVIVGERGGFVRLVTSPSFVATLRRARASGIQSWGTRCLPTAAGAGVAPSVAAIVVPELVHFDFALGSDEIIEGVTTVDDATQIDIDRMSVRTTGLWPLEERLARSGPRRASDLVDALRPWVHAASSDPAVRLGLTGGRDSGVIAQVARMEGLSLRCFTLGDVDYPDAVQAAGRARSLGWSHTIVPITSSGAEDETAWERIVRLSEWTEGSENASHSLAPELIWSDSGIVWLGGNGAEIGRMFYDPQAGATADAVQVLMRSVRSTVRQDARSCLADRIEAHSAALPNTSGPAALDDFYCTQRMRKWLGRLLPFEQIDNSWAIYIHPSVAGVLLSLDEEDRRTGASFDDILGDWAPPLRSRSSSSRVRRLASRARRGFMRSSPILSLPTWPDVQVVIGHMGEPSRVIYETLGRQWWVSTLEEARTNPASNLQVWNAIAVEALAEALGR